MLKIITHTGSSSKFSLQKERMWRQFHVSRCSTLKELWEKLMVSLRINTGLDPLLVQKVFEELFGHFIKKLLQNLVL